MDPARLTLELVSPDEEVRKVAVLALTELGDAAFLEALRQATTDPSPAVRFFARRGVDRLARRGAVPVERQLWQKALEDAAGDRIDPESWRGHLADPDGETRLRNVMATLPLSDPAILPLLWERLPFEQNVRVRASLVRAIARFRKPESFDLLAPLLVDPDPRVRANAVEALDDLADSRLAPLLEPFLADPDNRLRGNALKALSRFDRPRALRGAFEMAASPEIWMRATAVWLLRELGGEQARLALEGILKRETGEMAEKAAAALEELRKRDLPADPRPDLAADSAAFEAVRARLSDADPKVRLRAVLEAAELPRPRALPLLKGALLQEVDPHVVATLVKQLGRVGTASEIAAIAGFLTHPDARIRANAIEGLGALDSIDVLPLVEPLLEDSNQRVRANAAWVVHGRDPARAFATLKQMLLSGDARLQDSALYALREIGSEQVIEILESALASDAPEARIKILRVLETWGARNPLAARLHAAYKERGSALPWVTEQPAELARQLESGDNSQRLRAVEKLGASRASESRPHLERASRDPDRAVRKRAREILRSPELEEARREAHFKLGLAAYQWLRGAGDQAPRPLADLVGRAKQASRDMENGQDVLSSLSLRRQSLVDLGREVQILMESGQLDAPQLEPLLNELVKAERRREAADLPPAPGPPEPAPRLWLRFTLGTLAGIVLGVGTYLLFKMPPSPNQKPLRMRPSARSAAAAPVTTPAGVTAGTPP